MRFTAAQWEASRETRCHVLVTAGAGTGKTRTAVGRILYLLGAEVNGERIATPLALRNVAAITFTNHAAADLKSKLRSALRRAGLAREAYLVDTARIGTIHAFCGEILTEFALRTGGNPRREIMDEVARGAVAAEVVRDTILRAIEEDSVQHLQQLLAQWEIRDVARFVATLLDDLDRLRIYLDHQSTLGAQEQALVDLAAMAATTMDQRLDSRGVIDFDRVIVLARDLLRSDPQALAALRRRIRVLIVDEFQDVDPAQKEIAYLLGDPRSDRPDTTRLLLVGDPKQSIYRFRRADITVWNDVERDFREGGHGRVLTLHDNFRCTRDILAFVDATVGRILERPIDGETHQGYEVRFEPLVAAKTDPRQPPPVELMVVPVRESGRDYRAADLRKIEAAAVARRARELVDEGEAGWGQMAVIMPTWALMRMYQEAFDAVGANAYPLRTAGFYEQREIVDMVLALETIRDPTDDRALLGFLRSPFVGVRDETLMEIAGRGAQPYWTHAADLHVGEQSRLDFGLEMIRRLAAMRDRVPVDELLETLLDESGYVAHLRLQGDERAQSIANVEKLLRHARAASRGSLGEFLRMIREARQREGEEGEVPLVPRTNALTITTVHSAKGLEWDVVFWSDLVRWVKGGDDRDLLVGRRHIALRDPEADAGDQPERFRHVKEQLDREVYAERKRLWYVAATRAARRLIVTGLPAGAMDRARSNTVADHVWSALGPVPLVDGAPFTYEAATGETLQGIVRLAQPPESALPDGTGSLVPQPAAIHDLAGPLPAIVVRADRPRHSASELLQYDRCRRKHWFEYVRGVREPHVDRTTSDFIDAVARGHIVHDVLQWIQDADELDALLEDAIGRWDPTAPPPEAPAGVRYRSHLREEITTVVHDPDYRAIADLPTAMRELQFLHIVAADACLQGQIDLAAVRGSAVALLDVKTSRGDVQTVRRKAAQYRPQRDVYVYATERLSGLPVDAFVFHFSGAGVQTVEELTAETREELAQALRRTVQEMGGGVPRLTDHAFECQFCGYRRVGWCEGVAQEPTVGDAGSPQLAFDF